MKKLKNVSRIKMYAAGTALGLSLLAGCEAKTQAPVESKVVETTVDNTDVIDSTEVVVATQVPETTETVEVPKTTEATPESTEVVESTEVDPSNIIDTAETEEVFECTADDFIRLVEQDSQNYPKIDKAQLEAAVFSMNYDYFNEEEKDKILDYCGCSLSDMENNFNEFSGNLTDNILTTAKYYMDLPDGDKEAYNMWIKCSDLVLNEEDMELVKKYDSLFKLNAGIDFGFFYDGDPNELMIDESSSANLTCRLLQYRLINNKNSDINLFNKEKLLCSTK